MNRKTKDQRLRQAGLFNSRPQAVQDPLFLKQPEFFDAHDLLQVRYELLRANLIDGDEVRDICGRYGVSRQTFYNLSAKLKDGGSAGLLAQRPGPKGASKVTREVLRSLKAQLQRKPDLTGAAAVSLIEEDFAVSIHKRTAEKLLKQLRSKKNS